MPDYKKHIFPLLIIVVVGIILFSALEKSDSFFFLNEDNATDFLPSYIHNYRSIVEHGSIPLINFHQALGDIHLSRGHTSVLYPPVYAALFLSKKTTGNFFAAVEILVIFHLLISALGMYLLLARLRVRRTIIIFQCIIWITFPFVIIMSKNWGIISFVMAFLPFNFLLLDNVIKKQNFVSITSYALMKSLFYYTGFVQYFIYTIFFEGIYIFLYLLIIVIRGRINSRSFAVKKIIGGIIAAYVLSFYLMMALFLPMLNAQQISAERANKVGVADFRKNTMSLKDFGKSQVFLSSPANGSEALKDYSGMFHCGIPTIIVFLLSAFLFIIKRKMNRRLFIFSILAFLGFLFSTFIYWLFYYVPGFDRFRWPFKNFLFFLFFITIANALFLNLLFRMRVRTLNYLIYIFLVFSILLNASALWRIRGLTFTDYTVKPPAVNPVNEIINKDSGRIFTYKLTGVKKQDYWKYYAFNFAGMFDKYQFCGYNALMPLLNNKLILSLSYIGVCTSDMNQWLVDYLRFWSVRYIMTSEDEESIADLSSFPELNCIYRKDNVTVFENKEANPFVFIIKGNETFNAKTIIEDINKMQKQPVRCEIGVNSITAYPDNSESGKIIFTVAPLADYVYYVDGVNKGKINTELIPVIIDIPANTKNIKLVYKDPVFSFTVWLSGGCFIALLIALVVQIFWQRKKNRLGNL